MFASQCRQRLHTRAYEIARRRIALHTTLNGDGRGGEEAGSRLLFGQNYIETAKCVPVSTRGCSTSGANKSHANKALGPRVAAGNRMRRSQFLRSRANIGVRRPGACRACQNARAHPIKIVPPHEIAHKRESECPAFFRVRDRNV